MAVTNNAVVVPPTPPAVTNVPALPEGDILDEIEPIDIPPDLTWLWIVLGILVVVGLLIWAWNRWFRPGAREPEPLPGPPPYRVALAELSAVQQRLHEPEPFCTKVSDIVRIYLEDQFDLRAPERTTEEFLHELQESDHLNAAQKESLGPFLEQCDLVKFAKYEPMEAELRELHASAVKLVEETIPIGEGVS
jgi:hypothetical protein